jgi:hypothetical protein
VIVRLSLPLPPNMVNGALSRAHWSSKTKARTVYRQLCQAWTAVNYYFPPPFSLAPPVTITSVMYVHQTMDDDNAVARHKWAIDWLKDRGWLASDAHGKLRWSDMPHQRTIGRDEMPRLMIVLENNETSADRERRGEKAASRRFWANRPLPG